MAKTIGLEGEYTVYEDENGREFFKQPQTDGSTRKVYLDSQDEPQPKQPSNAKQEDEIYVIQNQKPQKTPPTQTVLLVPDKPKENTPPPKKQDSDPNVQVIYVDQPNTPRKQEPQTIYITQPPEEPSNEEPETIYVTQNRPSRQEKRPQQTVVVVQEPEPEPEPQTIYIQQSQPQQQQQPMVILNTTDRPGYYTPSPRSNTHKPPKYKTSRSQPVSPWPQPEPRPKPQPRYQLEPRQGQPTVISGGMLIIENDPWEAHAKVDHRNPNYQRGGGQIAIPSERLAWDKSPRIDDWNANYQRGGGNVLILHENLKWRKNKKRRPHHSEPPLTTRSDTSSVPNRIEVPEEDSISEGLPSAHEEEVYVNDYVVNKRKPNGYAGQFKGKIHHFKAGPKAMPAIDPFDRKPLVPLDPEKEVPVIKTAAPKPGANIVPRDPVKDKNRYRNNQPWFKNQPKPTKPAPKKTFLTSGKPLPPINYSDPHPYNLQHKPKYVPPQDKSLPWQKKEQKIHKFSSKSLEIGTVKKRKEPTRPQYYETPANYGQYNDNYGGPQYYEEDYPAYDERYSPEYASQQPMQKSGGYKSNHQDRESKRTNNKYTNVHSQHHFPTRKRNEPVY